VRLIVTGRVQGVFFRAACAREARARGLGGWVRNLPDGSVEVVAEGPDQDVAALTAWCREGPPVARVDGVESVEELPTGEASFAVR